MDLCHWYTPLVIVEPVNVIVPEPDEHVELGDTVLASRAVAIEINVEDEFDPQFPVPPLYTTL